MAERIEVSFTIPDTRALTRKKSFRYLDFVNKIEKVEIVDAYTVDKKLSKENLEKIAQALINPVVQQYKIGAGLILDDFDYAIEIGFLPGVTDNIGNTTRQIIADLLKVNFKNTEAVYSSQITFLKGSISGTEAEKIGNFLANSLIQRIHIKSKAEFEKDGGMDTIVPKVNLHENQKVMEVNLEIADNELEKLGREGIEDENGRPSFAKATADRRGPLALSLKALHIIRDYFREIKRNPTDVELESIAQTWSEHCKHTIFANPIDEIEDGLYRHYIKGATNEIRKKRGKDDICVSVFTDNAGGIIFDENYLVTDKVETHNSPSALDPFGGSITGIVGVNRDCLGFGLGSKPVANRYAFFFADPDDSEPIYRDKKLTNQMLSPRRIMEGVIKGVNAGGNESGIPTPYGSIYFEERYKGKPLVFCGTVGLIPRKVNGKPSHEKKAKLGDKIVVIGGRVGLDGIHGATFSSEALSSGSPATAVQIGDAITQKKFSDALAKEARDLGLYNSITDCGAGGISCSVAEMAKECGGCRVDLEKVPLKYANLAPWQIWISESQERMTLAVPPNKVEEFFDLLERRGVEATVIGEFTDSGRCVVNYNNKTVMDLAMNFLHDGWPREHLETQYTKINHEEPAHDEFSGNVKETLRDLLGRLNTCSYDFISYQYDHLVQGTAVLQPLQGKGKVNAEAAVIRPVLSSKKGVVLSHAYCPKYSDIDTYHMAAGAIDTAIRNAVCVGASLDKLALLDNFCWCSSTDPERLGQLKAAVKACYDYALAFGTPFISGKDSMFNDFKGFDADGQPLKISIPPTLLVSSIGVIDDVKNCVSLDLKMPGDLIYIIGKTKNELGGSEYLAYIGEKIRRKAYVGNSVPVVDAEEARNIYLALHKAILANKIASAKSVTLGGLGLALAKMAMAGKLGLAINLHDLPLTADVDRDDIALFSESQSRVIVTVAPQDQKEFEKIMKGLPCHCLGTVREDEQFLIKGLNGEEIIKTTVEELDIVYRKRFKDY